MKLSDKQKKLPSMICLLIEFVIRETNLDMTFGDAYRDPRATFPYSHPESLHKSRLAVDFNFSRNNKLVTESEELIEVGEFWESIGGSWGGRFKTPNGPDGNHFSLEHNGMK